MEGFLIYLIGPNWMSLNESWSWMFADMNCTWISTEQCLSETAELLRQKDYSWWLDKRSEREMIEGEVGNKRTKMEEGQECSGWECLQFLPQPTFLLERRSSSLFDVQSVVQKLQFLIVMKCTISLMWSQVTHKMSLFVLLSLLDIFYLPSTLNLHA